MKQIIGLISITGLLLANGCKIDNYDLPNQAIEGNVIDAVTGENIQTRQPNGIKIRLLEERIENAVPYDFWCKSDGSFKNTRLFAGKYKVVATEGAFEQSSVDTIIVDLGRSQNVSFKVEPFARLTDVIIAKSGSGIKATYKISQGTSTKKIIKSMLICYTSPILHEATTGKLASPENDLSGMTITDIENISFEDAIDNLVAGKTYYARVAVQTENPLNRFNYSPVIEIAF
ncbi:DUF3823 domain-containing protein [Agriterribacter sp.]|uniref:DUF3823 domain-containing protein n=1 Tax=Agriterribacter sp. TaxID=2821509 RepID=UPI002C8AF369|nr:DUF3823 domain-containing protein [Agriterribacter sp.]HTN08204.1 DUF3823 domain-containing protein [Agriterribacter sp.]